MKEELNKMPYKLRTKEHLMEALQALWDRVDPVDYRKYTEQLTVKIEDLIAVKGLATIH